MLILMKDAIISFSHRTINMNSKFECYMILLVPCYKLYHVSEIQMCSWKYIQIFSIYTNVCRCVSITHYRYIFMNMYILPHIGSLYIYNYRSISTANNSYEYFLELHMAIKIIVVFFSSFYSKFVD